MCSKSRLLAEIYEFCVLNDDQRYSVNQTPQHKSQILNTRIGFQDPIDGGHQYPKRMCLSIPKMEILPLSATKFDTKFDTSTTR